MSTDAEQVAREPSAYRPSIHFGERVKDNYDDYNRHLDGEIIDGCIREGDVTRESAAICHLEYEFGGVGYRLVVNVLKGEIVTGHPLWIYTETARDSGRWSSQQIADICEFLEDKGRPVR